MSDMQTLKNRRTMGPFLDRRSGDDRREGYELGYFAQGGIERRKGMERRQHNERRDQYIRTSQWSSICANPKSAVKVFGLPSTQNRRFDSCETAL